MLVTVDSGRSLRGMISIDLCQHLAGHAFTRLSEPLALRPVVLLREKPRVAASGNLRGTIPFAARERPRADVVNTALLYERGAGERRQRPHWFAMSWAVRAVETGVDTSIMNFWKSTVGWRDA